MPIPYRCSSCGQEYPVADHHAGRQVKCAFCGELTRAGPPAGAGSAGASPIPRRATSLHEPDLSPLSRLEPPSSSSSSPTPSPQYAMDYIAPPPKLAPRGRPQAVAPPPPPPRSLDFDDVVDVVPGPSATSASAPLPPLPPSARTVYVPPSPRSAPRAKRQAEELDDVWLLLSDEQARLISALLLVVMLGASFFLCRRLVSLVRAEANVPPEVTGAFATYTWLAAGWSVFLFFVVMTPLVLAACWLACVWTKWTLPDRPFLRACGAATVPYLLIFTFASLAAYKQLWPAIAVAIAAPFVLVIALKELMGLRWSATAVAALLLLVGVPVVSLITLPISLLVNGYAAKLAGIDPAALERMRAANPEYGDRRGSRNSMFGTNPSVGGVGGVGGAGGADPRIPANPAATRDPLYHQLAPFIGELAVATNQARNQTREQVKQAYDRLAAQILPLKPDKPQVSERWIIVKDMLDKLEAEMKRAPSATPPPEVFRAIEDVALKVPRAADEEFTNDVFRLRDVALNPLKITKVNAAAYLRGRTTQRWDLVGTDASIELELRPLLDPAQQRPWVATRRVIVDLASQKNLFAVEQYDASVAPMYGRIGSIGWTRVRYRHGVRTMAHQYVGRLPDAWLVVRLDSVLPTEEQVVALDKFVQGIDYRPLPRESATAPSSDSAATETAPPPSPPELGAGDVKTLLAIVEGADGHASERTDALKRLAKIAPADAQQRDLVAGVLERLVVTDAAFVADDAAETLSAGWWRPQTVDVLLPLLDGKEWVSWKRARAMKVLARTGDRRVATPIMRWLLKDTDAVVAAMIELGPASESEAIARLREKDPAARAAAARILDAVGTQKCLVELRRAANDPRDAGAAAAARSALETVLARVRPAKPSTSPATAPAR